MRNQSREARSDLIDRCQYLISIPISDIDDTDTDIDSDERPMGYDSREARSDFFRLPPRASRRSQHILDYLREPPGERSEFF